MNFGSHVPADDICWNLVMERKDITGLAFAQSSHEQDVCYLQIKINAYKAMYCSAP
jgi:hypothetical protein